MNTQDLILRLRRLRNKRVTRITDASFSLDRSRFFVETTDGFACYVGATRSHDGSNNVWHGSIERIVKDRYQAQQFLDDVVIDLRDQTTMGA